MPNAREASAERISGDVPRVAPLFAIATGFRASKMLTSAVELELFTCIARTGVDAGELAHLFALRPRPAEMLLSANQNSTDR